MKSIKAIVIGFAFVAITMLVIQLGYLFLAVGYNSLEADYPVLKDISWIFRYVLMIPVFVATLFATGYIVAGIAELTSKSRVVLHCLFVGIVSVAGMMYSATGYMTLTATGVVIFVLAQVGVVAGGFYWLKSKGLVTS